MTIQMDEIQKKELNQLLVDSIVNPDKADYIRIGYYYEERAPKYLYKYYRDNQRNVDAVFNNKMWYSAPISFNDPYDCDFALDEPAIINSLLYSIVCDNNMRKGSVAWKSAYITLKKEFPKFKMVIEDMKSSMGVACLCEDYNNVLMWSHYANNHKGMCVKYNLMDFNRILKYTPIPVIYSKNRNVLRRLRMNYIEHDITSLFVENLVNKEEAWKYENEWRIVRDEKACGEQWDNTRHGALLDSIRPEAVIIGCNADRQFENEVKGKCKSEGIRVFKMEKRNNDYGMNKIEL